MKIYERNESTDWFTSPGLDVDGDALRGPRVELHEDGGEGRVDDERHQEEKGEEAEGAEENEERGCVEEELLQERLLVDRLLLHCRWARRLGGKRTSPRGRLSALPLLRRPASRSAAI